MHAFANFLAGAALAAVAGTAAAVPLVPGQWALFDAYADMPASPWVDEMLDPLAFEFTVSTPALLTLVDGGLSGGRFALTVNGNLRGTTSVPTDAGETSVGLDFDAALADPRWSRGVFYLDAGTYSVTGSAVTFGPDLQAETGGVLLTPIPEPETWALLSAGAILVGLALRRQADIRGGIRS